VNELVDAIALRLRHNAAMDTVDTLATDSDRYGLLWDVLQPSQRLLEASTQRALEDLQRRHDAQRIAA
jgi:hypothetical protein